MLRERNEQVKFKVKITVGPTPVLHTERPENFDSHSVIPGAADNIPKCLIFNTKYEDPGTNVIANVTNVGDLREKVTLSWKNINVFVPQPKASICRRLCCGEKDDEPRIKQILSDGKRSV